MDETTRPGEAKLEPDDRIEDLRPAEDEQEQVKGGAVDAFMYFTPAEPKTVQAKSRRDWRVDSAYSISSRLSPRSSARQCRRTRTLSFAGDVGGQVELGHIARRGPHGLD